MRKTWFAIAVVALIWGCGSKTETSSASGGGGDYAAVQAVFTANCAGCHSGDRPKAGIDLTSYAGVMKGGGEGPVIKAGDPAGSILVQAMRGQGRKQMPPGKALAEDKIALVEAWVKNGAKG